MPLFFRNLVLNINYRKKNNGGISKVGEGIGEAECWIFLEENKYIVLWIYVYVSILDMIIL